MWQRFTEDAKRAVFHAQQEAGRMGTKDVASEHLLIGLLCQVLEQRERRAQVWPLAPADRVEPASVASHVFGELGLELDAVRAGMARQEPRAVPRVDGDPLLTPDSKRVIGLAYDEARQAHAAHIGTEHLLLGLMSETHGLAGRILAQYGADLARVRASVAGPGRTADGPAAGAQGFWSRLFRGG